MAARIGFSGFLTGSQVGINAASQSRNTNAEGWGVATAAGAPRATIVPKRGGLQVAPEGVNFEVVLENFDTPGPTPAATGSYDPQFHDVYYFWEFGDPGATFTAPEHIIAEHRDANKAYGPLASHTFAAPGTYAVSVLVIEPASGKSATATLDVTIGDSETLFAGFRTLYVDPDSDFSNAPSGAQLFDSLQDAFIRAGQTSTATDYFRIMLCRGKQHVLTGGQIRDGYKNLWVCSEPGAGARAEILAQPAVGEFHTINDNSSASALGAKDTDIVFHDLDITGPWDATIEEPKDHKPNFLWHAQNRSTYVLFHNVTGRGFGTFWADQSVGGTVANSRILGIANNTFITGWNNFAIYHDLWGTLALTGCRLTQDLNALSGGSKIGGHNVHGPIRLQSGLGCIVDSCDMFSRNGWFGNFHGMHTVQPCFRWNQTGNPNAKLNMQRCHMEGPGSVLALSRQNAGPPVVAHNALIEKSYLIAGAQAQEIAIIQHSGITIRNNVLNHPDVDRNIYGALRIESFIKTDLENDAGPECRDAPIHIYNNTLLYLISTANNRGVDKNGVFEKVGGTAGAHTNVVEENNLLYAPNTDMPEISQGPLDTAVSFPARYSDYRDRFAPYVGTTPNDVAPGQTLFLPYTNWAFNPNLSQIQETSPDDARYAHEINITTNNGSGGFAFRKYDIGVGVDAAFDATGVTLTNLSADTWLAGRTIGVALALNVLNIRTEFANPGTTIISSVPLPGAGALGAAVSGMVAIDDMLGNMRPAFPSIGAYELPG